MAIPLRCWKIDKAWWIVAWSFQIFPVVSWSFLKQQGRHHLPGRHNILNMLKTSVARARRCQSASQSAQERIKNGIFVAHTELKRLQAAPIASAFAHSQYITTTLLPFTTRSSCARHASIFWTRHPLLNCLSVCLFVCLYLFRFKIKYTIQNTEQR